MDCLCIWTNTYDRLRFHLEKLECLPPLGLSLSLAYVAHRLLSLTGATLSKKVIKVEI